MNLIYDTTIDALTELVNTADKSLSVHHVAIDYDGEVIIDPEKHFPHVALPKYKFCTQIKDTSLANVQKLVSLHRVLMSSFKDQVRSIGAHDGDISIAA